MDNKDATDGIIAFLIIVIFFLLAHACFSVRYYRTKAIRHNVASWQISTDGKKSFVWEACPVPVITVIEKEEE